MMDNGFSSNGLSSSQIFTVEDVANRLNLTPERAKGKIEYHGANPTGQGASEDGFILYADGNAYDRKSRVKYTSPEVAEMAGIEPMQYEPVVRHAAANGNGFNSFPGQKEAPIISMESQPKPEKKYETRTLEERGIVAETLAHFYIERTHEAYQFPTFDLKGGDQTPGRSRRKMFDPVAAGKQYSKNKKPIKYMWVHGDTDPIPPAYNLGVCLEFNEIWLVGGEVDVWTCHQLDIPAVCGFGETRLLDELVKAISKHEIEKLHIALDNDDAGKQGSIAAIEACEKYEVAYTVRQMAGAAGADVSDLFESCDKDAGKARLAMLALPHVSKATLGEWKFAESNNLFAAEAEQPEKKKPGRPPGSKKGEGSKDEKQQKSELLLLFLKDTDLILSDDEELYVGLVGPDGVKRNFKQDDPNLRSDLFDLFYEKTSKTISNDVVSNAMETLRGRARRQKNFGDVWLRVAPYQDDDGEQRIFLNLGDRDARCVEIHHSLPDGWQVTQEPNARFRWPKGMQPLPIPQRGGNIEDLRNCINAEDDAVWMMMLSWLVYAFHPPVRPYPALVLTGEQGTAKSTTSRMMRMLIDPHYSMVSSIAAMKDAEDMTNLCNTSHVLAYDNLSGLSAWQSDLLCQIATDGRIPRRKRFTDNETAYTKALSPLLLNGIDESLGREDFQSRSIRCNLPYIPKSSRQDEEKVWNYYNAHRAKMVGALCTILAIALKERPKVELKETPRMADFAKLIVAAENGGAMPWARGRFLLNYFGNIKEISETALESNPVALEIVRMVDRRQFIELTATDLLKALNHEADIDSKTHFGWPTAPNKLTAMLNRVAPVLRENGMMYTTVRVGPNRTKHIKIARLETPKAIAPTTEVEDDLDSE
jgi:hypothetical protein